MSAHADAGPLRVLHVSQSDLEGGAARAAFRLHQALRAAGLMSSMVVGNKVSQDPAVHQVTPEQAWASRRRRIRARLPPRERLPQAVSTFDYDVQQSFDEQSLLALRSGDVDVLLIHRITRFLTVRQVRFLYDWYRCPIVWLLHDQSAVTGGCSFSQECDHFTRSCGTCPQLRSGDPDDLSHVIWRRKEQRLAELPITFVGQSRDALSWVHRSSLFKGRRAERIVHPLDDECFRPVDRPGARERLRIPQDAKVIFMGAGDLVFPRKGSTYAVEAFRRVAERVDEATRERLFLLLAGKNGDQLLPDVPFPGRTLGLLSDDLALALCYQAADVFVSPSLADSGPLMVAESLLCGTPVAAFEVGAAVDLVQAPETGRVVPLRDTAALGDALVELLEHPRDEQTIQVRRKAASEYTATHVASAYIQLFGSLSETSRATS